MSDDAVWYLAYGSNLSGSRLQQYLDGCGDTSPPTDRRASTLPHRLRFAHRSTRWGGGGVAFVDPLVDPAAGTLAMAWLVRPRQFLGILRQENRGARVDVTVDDLPDSPGDTRLVGAGWYGLVLGVASPDHRPGFTFTTSARPLPEPTLPSVQYLETIASGLVDGHSLTESSALDYLATRGGSPERFR